MTCTICGQETLPGEPVELTPCGQYQNPDAKHVLLEHCIRATARHCTEVSMKILSAGLSFDATRERIKKELGL